MKTTIALLAAGSKMDRLARPHGVCVDRDGAVWIGDSENHRVRLWSRHPRKPFP